MQSLGVRADFLVLLEVKYKVKPRCQGWIKVRQRQLFYAISSLENILPRNRSISKDRKYIYKCPVLRRSRKCLGKSQHFYWVV